MTWIVIIIALAGTILNIKKRKEGFICWSLSNLYLMVYNFTIQVYPQSLLFAVYLGLAIWGLLSWRNEEA